MHYALNRMWATLNSRLIPQSRINHRLQPLRSTFYNNRHNTTLIQLIHNTLHQLIIKLHPHKLNIITKLCIVHCALCISKNNCFSSTIKNPIISRHSQRPIQQHPHRILACPLRYSQMWVIQQRRFRCHHNRILFHTHLMIKRLCYRITNLYRTTTFLLTTHINNSILGLSPLQYHIRTTLLLHRHKPTIQPPSLLLHNANNNLNSRIFQYFHTTTSHLRIRVKRSNHHLFQSLTHNQICTRRSLSPMRTRLERHIHRSLFQQRLIRHRSNRIWLSMRLSRTMMIPLTNDFTIKHNYRPNHRIRRCLPLSHSSQLQTPRHIQFILRSTHNTIHLN